MKTKYKYKYKYKLKVISGTFKSDYWEFDSIEEIDKFIVETRSHAAGLVEVGTMIIEEHIGPRKFKKVGER